MSLQASVTQMHIYQTLPHDVYNITQINMALFGSINLYTYPHCLGFPGNLKFLCIQHTLPPPPPNPALILGIPYGVETICWLNQEVSSPHTERSCGLCPQLHVQLPLAEPDQ